MKLSWWSAFACVVLVGCQMQASCGGKTLNMDNAKKFVSTSLATEAGVAPTTVTCPASVKIAKDATFQCTADFGGGAVATVAMKQTDEEANVTVTGITGIIISKRGEAVISKAIGEKANVHVTADCGPRVHPATPGATIMCTAKDAKGEQAQVEIKVKDVDGNISWRVVGAEAPPAPEAAPAPAAAPAGG